ncbi:MAG: DNA topoisomerase IB [Desulfovibrionales bacterium]
MFKDTQDSALEAGLKYVVNLNTEAITRRRRGKGFSYENPEGRTIRDPEILDRIRSLAIPPAWEKVRICPDSRGHIQAVGKDARGRKQYIYHPLWNEIRSRAKFDELRDFLLALPRIRRNVRHDLARAGFPKKKVLALLVTLMEQTLIRVGSDKYARDNKSFGLTTLENTHLDTSCPGLCLSFPGKQGKQISVSLDDRRLIRLLHRIQELPGQRLFQYVDAQGEIVQLDSADLNEYLKQISKREVTAKDYRTWGGTLLAMGAFELLERPRTARKRKKTEQDAVRLVAQALHNTPSVCRKYYIHPRVIEAWNQGKLEAALQEGGQRARRNKRELSRIEEGLLLLLQKKTRKTEWD